MLRAAPVREHAGRQRRRRRAGGGRAVRGDRRRVVGRRRDIHARVSGSAARRPQGAGAASSPSGAASTRRRPPCPSRRDVRAAHVRRRGELAGRRRRDGDRLGERHAVDARAGRDVPPVERAPPADRVERCRVADHDRSRAARPACVPSRRRTRPPPASGGRVQDQHGAAVGPGREVGRAREGRDRARRVDAQGPPRPVVREGPPLDRVAAARHAPGVRGVAVDATTPPRCFRCRPCPRERARRRPRPSAGPRRRPGARSPRPCA